MQAPEANVLIAYVTVGDETMIVKVNEIHVAIFALNGSALPGTRIQADIRIDAMSESDFAALPEYQ